MEIMNFVLDYWYVWIVTMIVSSVIVACNQIKRVKRLSEAKDMDTARKGVIKGIGSMIFFYIIFVISAILLVINVIVMILRAV